MKPVTIFINRYRQHEAGKKGEAKKVWFVSFSYLVNICGSFNELYRHLKENYEKMSGQEGIGLKWADPFQVLSPNYFDRFHESVHYAVKIIADRGLVDFKTRIGVNGKERNYTDEVVEVPGPLREE